MAKFATKTISKSSPFAKSIENGDFASAGPNPNITGMKNLYWGKDAKCIRIGVYVYKVDDATYSNAK